MSKPIKQIMKKAFPEPPLGWKAKIGNCDITKCNAYEQLYTYHYKRGKKAKWVNSYRNLCIICITRAMKKKDLSCHCDNCTRLSRLYHRLASSK